MAAKQILYAENSRSGDPAPWVCNQLADVGEGHPRPKGRNVALLEKKFGGPTITKDGSDGSEGNRAERTRSRTWRAEWCAKSPRRPSDVAGRWHHDRDDPWRRSIYREGVKSGRGREPDGGEARD